MRNEELIKKFVNEQKANGKSIETLRNYSTILRLFSKELKRPFKKATKTDILTVFIVKKMAPLTANTYKIIVRRFYRWLYDLEIGHYPVQVKDLQVNGNSKGRLPIRPEDVLTKEDIATLVKSCMNFRDQALVSVLYESGTRRSEFLDLKIKNVLFDQYGAVIMVAGKTGDRRLRLIESIPHLQQWLQVHPLKDDKNAPLWVHLKTLKPLSRSGLFWCLHMIGKRAKIEKPVNPHAFRHSRLTETAKFLSDAKQRVFAGWSGGSDMNRIYTHLSGRDLDEDFMREAGILRAEEKTVSPLKPKACRRCQTNNSGIAEYCVRCGLPFDESIVLDNQVLLEKIGDLEKQLKLIIKSGAVYFKTEGRINGKRRES